MFYKYRSIQNFRYFADIVMKNRLYAARYTDLNDPMEGQYYINSEILDDNLIPKIFNEKQEIKICSLSRTKDNYLMWSHYADSHRGIVIGVEIDESIYELVTVQYTGPYELTIDELRRHSAKEILSHKMRAWEYEAETRIFTYGTDYVQVRVKEIITGLKMSKKDYGFIKDFVSILSPKVTVYKAEEYMRK